MRRNVSPNLFPFLWSHDFKRTFQCMMPLSVRVLRRKVARNKLHKAKIENSLQRDKARCQKQNQLLKFATIAAKNEWMWNNLRKIVWCNSPFRTAQESWHDLTKEKIVESKAAKAIQKTLTMLIKIRFSEAGRFFQPFMKLIDQNTMIFSIRNYLLSNRL